MKNLQNTSTPIRRMRKKKDSRKRCWNGDDRDSWWLGCTSGGGVRQHAAASTPVTSESRRRTNAQVHEDRLGKTWHLVHRTVAGRGCSQDVCCALGGAAPRGSRLPRKVCTQRDLFHGSTFRTD